MTKKTLFFGALGVMMLIFAAALAIFEQNKAAEEADFVSRNAAALERAGAPVKGPRDAKVTIVEFFDPACETCSQFYPLVNDIIRQYPGKVKVMMRYAPLHQGSEDVVKMLEAAHRQGKFWPAVQLLFANQSRWVAHHVSQPGSAKTGILTLSLDEAQFERDWQSTNVNEAVQQDIRDGQTLGVRATPEFFVNGKPMPSFGYQQLKDLVEEAIAEAY